MCSYLIAVYCRGRVPLFSPCVLDTCVCVFTNKTYFGYEDRSTLAFFLIARHTCLSIEYSVSIKRSSNRLAYDCQTLKLEIFRAQVGT